MTVKTINMNDVVSVRLTDVGRKELQKQHDALRAIAPHLPPKKEIKEVDGWSRWQIHELMRRLGHLLSLGSEPPFELDIIIHTVREVEAENE
jgi:hypothetical protein